MNMKITLIIITTLIVIILLDTIHAKLKNSTPIIKISEYYNGGTLYKKDKGLLVDTHTCTNAKKTTTFKWKTYNCPSNEILDLFDQENKNYTKIIIDEKEMSILENDYNKLIKIFDSLNYKVKECEGPIHYNINALGNCYYFYGHHNQLGFNNLCASLEGNNLNEIVRILSFVYSDNEMNNIENVKMEIKEGTLTKTVATILIKDTNVEHYMYGLQFRIDKKEESSWKTLLAKENVIFNDIGYNISENNVLELNQDWSLLYGELSEGKYRLAKSVCTNEGCSKKSYFSVEFEIWWLPIKTSDSKDKIY